MAARHNLTQTQRTREKIQASQLINRLQSHALGEADISPTQIKAIEILLRKSLPDLTSVELTGEGGGPVRQEVEMTIIDGGRANQG